MPAANDALQGDPLVSFNFCVEMSGVITGYFTEASGLGSEHEVIEHKIVSPEGREIVRKIPGRLKWGDIKPTALVVTPADEVLSRQIARGGES